jgi:AcrR family transcriptional regulator
MRAEVGTIAFGLFSEQGFENTTVDEIARAADMSRTSFFRYFATKEDVVLGHLEEVGHAIAQTLSVRPGDEDPWDVLRHGFRTAHEASGATPEDALRLARMLLGTPSLKSRHLEKQTKWQELFIPEIARRLGIPADDPLDPRPRALVAAALGCLDAAFQAWAASDGSVEMPVYIDRAMETVASRR